MIDLSNIIIENSKLSDIHSIQYGSNFKIAVPLNLNLVNSYHSVVTNSTISFPNHDETIQLVYAHQPIFNASRFMDITAVGLGTTLQQEFSNEPSKAIQQHYSIYKEPIQHHWHNDLYSMGAYSGYSTSIFNFNLKKT